MKQPDQAAEPASRVEDVAVVGGHPSLDFSNTASGRTPDPTTERLHSYDDLVTWAARVGVVSGTEGGRLRAQARKDPAAARRVLTRALTVREAIYGVFSTIASNRSVLKTDLRVIDALAREAFSHRALLRVESAIRWRWTRDVADLARPIWPIALGAAELLTGDDLGRVKECGNHPCSWLFLDRSRNHSRRWCEMSDCGNRVKARAFAARRRAG